MIRFRLDAFDWRSASRCIRRFIVNDEYASSTRRISSSHSMAALFTGPLCVQAEGTSSAEISTHHFIIIFITSKYWSASSSTCSHPKSCSRLFFSLKILVLFWKEFDPNNGIRIVLKDHHTAWPALSSDQSLLLVILWFQLLMWRIRPNVSCGLHVVSISLESV